MLNKLSYLFDTPLGGYTSSQKHPKERLCEHAGCVDPGIYRAPKSRYHLESGVDDWHWFCLAHIRDYNAKWNYYCNMSENEIEHERRSDTTWQRPSWPLGAGKSTFTVEDPFDLFTESLSSPSPSLTSSQSKALNTLEMTYPFSKGALQKKYRELVKRHHPDINGGSHQAEEMLKRINEAYDILKKM